MQYICNDCDHTFSFPEWERYEFDHAFGTYRGHTTVCPECGGSYEAASFCPSCGEAMHTHETLCSECRRALKSRLLAFFDTLTEAEEKQIDAWMDGNSICDRKNWEA